MQQVVCTGQHDMPSGSQSGQLQVCTDSLSNDSKKVAEKTDRHNTVIPRNQMGAPVWHGLRHERGWALIEGALPVCNDIIVHAWCSCISIVLWPTLRDSVCIQRAQYCPSPGVTATQNTVITLCVRLTPLLVMRVTVPCACVEVPVFCSLINPKCTTRSGHFINWQHIT